MYIATSNRELEVCAYCLHIINMKVSHSVQNQKKHINIPHHHLLYALAEML